MKRRILSLILSLILVTAMLSGCRSSAEQEMQTAGTPAETAAAVTTEAQATVQEPETTQSAGAEAETPAETKPLTNADVATFAFDRDNFPTMDGSTSMVPLGQAIASILLGESTESVSDLAEFHKTTQSFRNLKGGYCDILIVGEPNAAVFDEMKEEGFQYELEEIATDGLIFVVNKNNPVNDLTTEQIRDIYTGKITNWKEVGGNDAPIIAFQRNEGAGSQALMKKLVMKDTPLMEAPTTLIATEMGELMESVRSYDNSANAIGYSVYYYANDMKKADGLKLISVDGVEPSAETIRTRKYPHLNAYYSVIDIREPKDSSARLLFEWLMSKDGQALIDAEGYVAAKDPEALSEALPGGQIVKTDHTFYKKLSLPEDKYTRLSEGDLSELKARDDYGWLYPYNGSESYVNDGDGYAWSAGAMKGFFDDSGRLVTDPVYTDIEALKFYDRQTDDLTAVPIWVISRVKDKENVESSFAAMDGSFVCDKWYDEVRVSEDRILCIRDGSTAFDAYDLSGKLITTSEKIPHWNDWKGVADPGEGWYGYVSYGDGWYGYVSYGDGWYMISSPAGDGSYNYYYVNEADGRELGPYSFGWDFCNGRAVVEDAGTDGTGQFVGVIDEVGAWVIEPWYENVQRLKNGSFIALAKEVGDLYDRNGKLLKTIGAQYVQVTNFGFTAYRPEPNDHLTCYDFEGNLLLEDFKEKWQSAGPDGLIWREEGAGVKLKNILTGKRIYVEGAKSVDPFYRVEDEPDVGKVVAGNSWYDTETNCYYCHDRVYDTDLDLLYDETGSSVNIRGDECTGDWYYLCEDEKGGNRILDEEFREICTVAGYPQIANGKFIFTDEYACTCTDKNGETVFCYTLLNSMDD